MSPDPSRPALSDAVIGRCTPRERVAFGEAAEALNISISAFVRLACLAAKRAVDAGEVEAWRVQAEAER